MKKKLSTKEIIKEWKKQMEWLGMTQRDLGSAARIVVSDFNRFITPPHQTKVVGNEEKI